MNKIFCLILGIFLIITPSVSAVIISEIMYAPNFNEFYNEWIEIYNDNNYNIYLDGWTLCGKDLLGGYIDKTDYGELKLNNTMKLPPGGYAIITDGGSGTEVYSNFDVYNSTALHVDGSTLCGGLSNSGKNITLIDEDENLIDNVNYTSSWGALDNDNSLQFDNGWCENLPTPGNVNNCPGEIQNGTQESPQNNETEENVTIEETNISETVPQSSITGNIVQEEDTNTIVLDTQNIKSEDNTTKLDKSDYALYGLIGLGILVALLFLVRKSRPNKNEFR